MAWGRRRLRRVPSAADASPDVLKGLLPDHWAEAHPEHALSHRLEESRQKAQRRDQRRAARRLRSM
jgi:hypothetical protein